MAERVSVHEVRQISVHPRAYNVGGAAMCVVQCVWCASSCQDVILHVRAGSAGGQHVTEEYMFSMFAVHHV